MENQETVFMTLVRFTPEGRVKLTNWPQIYQQLGKELEQIGGHVLSLCGTTTEEQPAAFGAVGRYDYVIITEAPSLQAIAQAWLPLVTSGLVATETIGLVPEREFSAMIRNVREPVSVR